MKKDMTKGSVLGSLIVFSLPYLLSCFLQSFYGLADLFIVGRFNGADSISAVSIGSQIMHMLTVIIIGLSAGTTVTVAHAVGAGSDSGIRKAIGSTIRLFAVFAAAATVVLFLLSGALLRILQTPAEAYAQARQYILLCFAGIPFIVAYNVIAAIFRGIGDTRSPLLFVAAAGVINLALDWLFIGPLGLRAAGAAAATTISQAAAVLMSLAYLLRSRNRGLLSPGKEGMAYDRHAFSSIIKIGVPIALQDGLIQVSFLVITAIANARGLEMAAAVGVVEKFISFVFLVPSAMSASVSAIAAQNAGAGLHGRGRKVLRYALLICIVYGIAAAVVCQFKGTAIVSLLSGETGSVAVFGAQYLRSYSIDTVLAGIHFCFSGYFCAYSMAMIPFAHNMASAILIRIPAARLTSIRFPDTLFPMGLAAPAGSLLSDVICIAAYCVLRSRLDAAPGLPDGSDRPDRSRTGA